MQLINIGNAGEHVAGAFVQAVSENNEEQARIELNAFSQPDPILRAYYLLAVRQNYSTRPDAILLADAITELAKKVFTDQPIIFLEKCLPIFLSEAYTTPDTSGFRLADDEMPQAVVVSALEDALEEGDTSAAVKAVRDILMVMDSKKYLNELLLEIACHMHFTDGRLLEIANAVSKALELFQWQQSEELIVGLLTYLSSDWVQNNANRITPVKEDADYSDFFQRAASSSAPDDWQFITHARQVYRYTSTKYHTIWPLLTARLHERFPEKSLTSPVEAAVNKELTSVEMKDLLAGNDRSGILNAVASVQHNGTKVNEIIPDLLPDKFSAEMLIMINAFRRVASALKYPANIQVFGHYASFIIKNHTEFK